MNYDEWKIFRERLRHSKFRSKFELNYKDEAYYSRKGERVIYLHALDFIRARLAPAFPKNDTKQTPLRGHPVFTAQHATATCCRKCLETWHKIPRGSALTEKEIIYVIDTIMFWLNDNNFGDKTY